MTQKILFIALAFTFIIYFLFSFYYNSEILTLNQDYQKYTSKLNQIEIENQYLQNSYTQSISINKLLESIDISQYQPIQKSIDININSIIQ